MSYYSEELMKLKCSQVLVRKNYKNIRFFSGHLLCIFFRFLLEILQILLLILISLT